MPALPDIRIKLDRLAPPDDSRVLDASRKRHGLLPKLSGTATEFLNGSGTFATPTDVFPSVHASSHENGGSDEISVAGLSGVLADPQTAVAHAILDGARHSDTVAQGVSRGSLIYGNATPKWDELTVGAVGTVLQADGTDAAWGLIVAAGVYSPTRSAESNLDANVTPSEAQYLRVGATVTVSGRFTADPTIPATVTSFELTLPVASNLGAVEDLAGVAFAAGIAGQGAGISGSVANNTAVVSWVSGDVTSQTWSYTFSYQVI